MKKFILLITCIVSFSNCIANDTLLFVSGLPYQFDEQIEELVQRPIIFSYNASSNKLDTLFILTKNFSNIRFINVYNKYGYLAMLEEFYNISGRGSTHYFSFINLNKIIPMQKMKLDGGSIESNLIIRNMNEILYCIGLPVLKKELGVNEKMEQQELSAEIYNDIYIQGSVGTPINNTEFLLLYNETTNNNKLHISKGFGRKIGPVFYMQPPKELYNAHPPALKSIIVNDFHSMIISYDDSRPTNSHIGEYYCIIYDKISKEWYKQIFRGNMPSVRSYDNGWVAGTIIDIDKGEYYDNKTARYTGEKFDFKRESPGYKDRIPIDDDYTDGAPWGDCFDERMQDDGSYYPGLLYLFNVHTKDYIEWDTKQGDSEVLLVQDDYVYYRVNTKILKSAIIENTKLGEPELLIDDARVRDIHWAYLKK